MTDDNLNELAQAILNKKFYLPEDPILADLHPFIKGLKTKRLRKKFFSNPWRYSPKYISKSILHEYLGKRLAKPIAEEIYATMSRESFAKRVLQITPH